MKREIEKAKTPKEKRLWREKLSAILPMVQLILTTSERPLTALMCPLYFKPYVKFQRRPMISKGSQDKLVLTGSAHLKRYQSGTFKTGKTETKLGEKINKNGKFGGRNFRSSQGENLRQKR